MSPYIFILDSDLLQQMIAKNGEVKHPLIPDRPCVTLQYADDTLIVCRADRGGITALKERS